MNNQLHHPCLLCNSTATDLVSRISAESLVQAYRTELQLSVDIPVDQLNFILCSSCDLYFFSPPITGDEDFYALLQQIPWYYAASKQEFRIAAEYVSFDHDVLEIGAGRGLFRREISPRSYTGLEFSPSAIEAAAASGVQLLAQSIEEHARLKRDAYDVVCSFQVLEHVAAPRSFLEAAVTCLKPGGLLIVSVPGEDSFARYAYWDVLNMPPHHVTRWTDRCLRSIASLLGLQLVTLTPEPLGRNMIRLYAGAMADRSVARWTGFEPMLIDPKLRQPAFRFASAALAACARRYLRIRRGARRGHAVLAAFRK